MLWAEVVVRCGLLMRGGVECEASYSVLPWGQTVGTGYGRMDDAWEGLTK